MGGAGRTANGDDMADDGPAITLKTQAGDAFVTLRENVAVAAWRSKGDEAAGGTGTSLRTTLPDKLKHVTYAKIGIEADENSTVLETSRTYTVAEARLPETISGINM